ncbi:hypothetical protein NliqN6_2649 [Naganishia liquefaciens]|uniref:Uncharacterized protein n=1 Tax=Naganishia liquefaciens TaxID=104408 RepID=A0A8H3YFI7_9TREE|nr:hypothetical protein NliqN6_2649 [Naganishia liquefaciens]
MGVMRESNVQPGRKLSYVERMSLSLDLLGKPSLVTYIAVYPSAASMPTMERILERAETLAERYPLLRACVLDARTTKPRWAILPADAVDTRMASLVNDVPIQDVEAFRLEADQKAPDVSRTLENIFDKELHDKHSVSVSGRGLLWRVVRYLGDPKSASHPNLRPAYIALTCNHVISDGRSGQTLLGALLSDKESRASGLQKSIIAPSMQDTINCRPSLGFLFHQVWYEVIVPKLPRFLERRLRIKPCWPAVPPYGGNLDRIEKGDRLAIHHIQLSPDTLKRLKENGKANGVRTLHPTLQIAAVVALWIAVGNGASTPNHSDRHGQLLRVSHATAASHCSPELGHPSVTGNYIGYLLALDKCDGHVDFWQAARDHAKWLHSPGVRRRGCQVMGSLRYIPDGINNTSEGSLRPTGWESFFLDRAGRAPADSLSSSNLGFYALPPGSTRLAWSQATIPGTPLQINIIGHDAGLEVNISRPVNAWVDDSGYEPSEHFSEVYKTVLSKLAGVTTSADGAKTQTVLTYGDIRTMAGRT